MPNRLRDWLFALDRFELRLRIQAGRARNSAIIHAAQAYQYSGSVPAYIAEGHRRRLKQIIAGHYEKVIPHFAARALSGIKSHAVGSAASALVVQALEAWIDAHRTSDVEFHHLREIKSQTGYETKARPGGFEAFMQEWIVRESLRKAALIAATDMGDVRDAISEGVADGLGTTEIASRIRKVSQLTPFRAATVARTETHAAATFGSIESVRDAEQTLGVQMLKEWLPTLDDRTRPAHAAMNGQQPIPLNEKFVVDGELMDRPGDPSASPANVIACRCALGYTEAT